MASTVKVPVLGTMPKGAVVAGVGAAVVVTGYLIYKHNKASAAATTVAGASGYGYGASGYGYAGGYPGSGYYGYGSEFQAYPWGEEYGYGAYGYGEYNPYTGQYIGPIGGGSGVSSTGPTTGTGGTGAKSGWVTIGGKRYYYSAAKNTLGSFTGTGKKRKWKKTTV
jgi:hypothetical protein